MISSIKFNYELIVWKFFSILNFLLYLMVNLLMGVQTTIIIDAMWFRRVWYRFAIV